MRIDEVIVNEKPFGALDKMAQFGKNVGNTVAGALGNKGSGNRAIAGKEKAKAMKVADTVNNDFITWKARNMPTADAGVTKVSDILNYLKSQHKITNLVSQGFSSIAPILKQSQRALSDVELKKIFLALAYKSMNKAGEQGAGAPDQGNTEVPGVTPMIQNALDKLDPELQQQALTYLRSKVK